MNQPRVPFIDSPSSPDCDDRWNGGNVYEHGPFPEEDNQAATLYRLGFSDRRLRC